ncbi:HAUS augmin-like complex subunit 6 isoform X1 [Monodelphis domestica]|uniref:HAUS augmin-like complex subunit 6 isoform X1 n=2 Tax=Monodelphis domestica TaxID=13616 RepID=UPI0024E21913|nr:HAUS augmin-like complex subunit 6 isoform X1 [Monodelphis domestica]
MNSPAVASPTWKKDHLWQILLALDFEPDKAAAEAGKLTTHTKLGANMFDKPNNDAFHIVAYFLFTALNPSHAKEVFRFCWPPLDRKADAEFRKQCCEWLKKISDECGSSFPQVVGSLFLFPGGPKFVELMYCFARFVAVQYIKTNSECSNNKYFIETFNKKSQEPCKSFTRCYIGRTRFLQILQKEDSLIRQYQENSQSLIKEIRDLNTQYSELQKLQKKNQNEDPRDILEKVQKVRLMWDSVMETLTFLEKEREVVNSVITGHVDQYTLDGAGVAIKVPRLLLDRIEKQMCHLFIGNLYEAGKLNLLTVIQLLNEALKILKNERSRTDQTGLTADLNFVEREARVQKITLSHVKQLRYKIKQEAALIRQSNAEKQRKWSKKWEEFLNQAPFSLIKDETPALDLLPAMSPLSFDPASEEVYENSVFFRYPISLPDASKKHTQENFHGMDDNAVRTKDDSAIRTTDELVNRVAVLPMQSDTVSDSSSVILLEKDTKTKIIRDKEQSLSKNKKKVKMDTSQSLSAQKNRESCMLSTPKLDPFKKEVDHLAEEVAKAVIADSPQLYEGRDVELGTLINHLFSNPFLTRKQIPRTPENLTPEIRNSQREVFQDEVDPDIEVVQTDAVLSDQTCLNTNSFLSGSAFSKSFLPEEKGSPKLGPQENIGTSHLDPLTSKCAEILNKGIQEQQNSECSALQEDLEESDHTGSILSAAENKMDGVDGKEEHVKKLNFSSASCKEQSWVWNSMILNEISSNGNKAAHFDILHETLPEVTDNLSLNSSFSTESIDEVGQYNSVANDVLKEDSERKISNTEERTLNFDAIRSRLESLKKSVYEKKKEFSPETYTKRDSELGYTSNNMETDDIANFLGDTPALYTDNIRPSLQKSLGERKSLSPLIKFSPEERRLRPTKPNSIGEFLPYLKEDDNLDRRLELNPHLI